jgi:uncharacterized protein (TIGR03067 family)
MVLTAGCLVLGAATLMADDTAKKDLDALQGTWKLESLMESGKPAPADALKQITIVVKDGKYSISAGGKELETGSIKLDPSKKPKTIDFEIASGNDKGKTQLGVYELKDDTFTFCMARAGQKERPSELASTEKSQTILTVAKKAK